MAETEDNRKLAKITQLLEKGGTMLATHHECGAPMFRYRGKIVCPVCDFTERQASEPASPTAIIQESFREEGRKEALQQPIMIESAIKQKIGTIASSLEKETDLQRVKCKLECIELGMRVLKLLGE